jgi:predicted alpha/beta superfamily hydrolase
VTAGHSDWPSGWRPYAAVHGKDNTVSGTVLVWPRLEGAPGIAGREVCVYLPPSLAAVGGREAGAQPRRYPVLYFHDGQNVFDARTSFVGEWHADETLEALAGEGYEAIAVAVPNGGEARMDEYNPWRSQVDWRGRPQPMGGRGDAYLDWLVGSVKPLIDRSFPTLAAREATGIIGSSLGGLISLYALFAHRAVFGLAGVMSASVRWNDFAVVRLIDEAPLPPTRIHLDMGGREWRGMIADARRVRDALLARGWRDGVDLHYVEERYARHNEGAWSRRLPDALRFLLADLREPSGGPGPLL